MHLFTTAREIIATTGVKLDAFVSGVGAGGTITGVSEVLRKEIRHSIQFIAGEPADSSVLSGIKPGAQKIQGIGVRFVPEVLNTAIYDRIIQVQCPDAKKNNTGHGPAGGELCGYFLGRRLVGSLEVARGMAKGQAVLALLPDTGERYLSTELWDFPEANLPRL